MKRWKTTFAPLLAAILLTLSLLPAAMAAGADGAVLRVGSGGAARGETFTLPVLLTGDGVWGGSLNVTYNPTVLKLISVEKGDLMGEALFQSNPYYSEDSVRISFAAVQALTCPGTVCILTFQVLENAPLEASAVSFANVRLYDENAQACTVTTESGTAQVGYSGLAVQSVEAVRGQSVRVALELTGDLDPAGGSFTIRYDTSQMTAGTVTASELLTGYSLVSNETAADQIRVTWAGSEALKTRGTLCIVTFHVSQQAVGTPTISIQNLHAYDENAQKLDTVAEDGTVTLLTPTETSPKLWLVGGSIDPETKTAEINVVLEGRGVICGGQFTLSYPTGTCSLESTQAQVTGAANTNTPGTVTFSWADVAPVTGSQALLRLTFQVNEVTDIPLTLHVASLLTGDGVPVTDVDIRSGKLLPADLAYQAPALDSAAVTAEGGQTRLEAVLDVAAARGQGTQRSLTGENLLVVFYEDGKMKALSRQDFTVSLDPNGIAQVTLSASCAGTADQFRVFLLGEGGALLPLAEDASYKLEVIQP